MEQQLPPELDAHVAGTVRALQDDMQRVLERLSELELLTSRQVRGTAPTGGQLGVGRGRSGGRPRVVPRPGRAEAALEATPGARAQGAGGPSAAAAAPRGCPGAVESSLPCSDAGRWSRMRRSPVRR